MNYKSFDLLNRKEMSVIGFGCWATGGTWNNTEDKKSIEAIRTAIENGVNFFDVAPVYGKGHAEIILGEAIKEVAPLCSNCHRMVHRKRGILISIEDLKEIIGQEKK